MKKSILIVDDHVDDLKVMKDILESGNYNVTTATDGAKALDALSESEFELIMIDIQMPTLSGYDLLRLMREKINHHSKMMFVSIVPKKDVDLDTADGFIQKPFSEEDLIKGIEKVLG